MASQAPFHRFAFTLIQDKKPRRALSMAAAEGGMYELHVEKGSASNPSQQFTRQVPMETAQRLGERMQACGVYGWSESYGDASAPGSQRWSLSIVFKEGVFSMASQGGSDVPAGFDELLDELYRLDFPRVESPKRDAAGSSTAGFGEAGIDFSQMAGLMKDGGLAGLDAAEMRNLLAEAQSNPRALQERMRQEFRHMPPDEQERMLDALASSGMASRAWWERFLRG